MTFSIINGDSLKELQDMKDNSIDAIITDPPYGLSAHKPDKVAKALTEWISGNDTEVPQGRGFMGNDWDSFVPPPALWKECYRVLKPGGHIAVFAGSRTQDIMGLSIRLGGFEIRDSLAWIYGSGMPKGQNISKAIDKAAGVEREVISRKKKIDSYGEQAGNKVYGGGPNHNGVMEITAPSTDEAKEWEGWGTALKPAIEPIILARKPISEKTVAKNVLKWGTGAINIDVCRVGTTVETWPKSRMYGGNPSEVAFTKTLGDAVSAQPTSEAPAGRYPANVVLDESAAEALGEPRKFFHVFKYNAKAGKKERPVIEREAVYGLRDDLTEDQVDYVLARLREAGVETG